jgi:HD-GYP domain-containing protein (c-di-GMP phosphodiesterase class II)
MSQATDQVFSEFIFLAVPTASLIHRKTSVTDLYIRMPSDRMIKVAHKGGSIDVDRIQRLGDKNVQYLYVYRTDFSNIVNDLVRGAEGLNQLANVPADLKLAKFFTIAETVYTELMRLPITDESLGRAVRLTGEISTAMREKPDFAKLIKTVVGMGDEFARHSLGSVVMSNLLVNQLEWSSPKLLDPVTMGAFFHDIGLKEISPNLWFKNKVEMTQEEVQVWEMHPALGVKLLSQMNVVTPDVLRIVQEHHEIPNGTGFPAKLRLDRIFPMAKVVSMGNVLAHDLFDGGQNHQFSMEAMAQKIDHVYSVMFGADLSRAARKIFRKDEPK